MKSKISIYLMSTVIFLLVALMIVATYAYFKIKIIGDNENSSNTAVDNLSIKYIDTSNVSLVNAHTGQSVTKIFTIKNTGKFTTYYDIYFNDVVNNFDTPDELILSLTSNSGAYVTDTIVPVSNENLIASSVRIAPGTVHSYNMIIKLLKTDENKEKNKEKTFSAKIGISSTFNKSDNDILYKRNSLENAILTNNNILTSDGIDFSSTDIINGLYYTNNSIDGKTIYYFRGDNSLNNNLIFAGKCWKIIRTTEDYGVRIIYNGVVNNNKCENVSNNSIIDLSTFNDKRSANAYVGYMYGNALSNDYTSEHANNNSSIIKSKLENWYSNNIETYANYISDSYYCNNRKSSPFILKSVRYGSKGYGNNNTGYLSQKNILDNKPSYNCYNKNDIFTVNNKRGNSKLTKPIGLITSDEAMYAGLNNNSNKSNYLYTGSNYYTMSPTYFNGTDAYISYIASNGKINSVSTRTSYGIRPVITLKHDTILINGDGSESAPYKIN